MSSVCDAASELAAWLFVSRAPMPIVNGAHGRLVHTASRSELTRTVN